MFDPNEFEKWQRPDFYKGYVLLWLLPLLVIAVLNFIVDPFDIYGVDLTEPLEHNSYELKLKLFRELPNPPEILVLGSSRLDTFDPELIQEITGKSCFNFALAAVEPGSMFAALKIVVEEYEVELDTVIIGIDPGIFNENFRLNTMVQMVPAFSKYMKDHPYLDAIGLKATFLFRPEQLRSSLKVLRREAGFVDMPLFREFREDGLVSYPIWDKAKANGTLDLDTFLDWQIPTWVVKYGIQNFDGPSEQRLDYWYETLETCSSHGINVITFMAPNHPRLAEKITEIGADVVYDEIKAIIAQSVTRHDGIFFDFSDIESFGGDPDLFYDGVHMQKENMELMTRALLASETSESSREAVR